MSLIRKSSSESCETSLRQLTENYFDTLVNKLKELKADIRVNPPLTHSQAVLFPPGFNFDSGIALGSADLIRTWIHQNPRVYGILFPKTEGRVLGYMTWRAVENSQRRGPRFSAKLESYKYYYFHPQKEGQRAFSIRAESSKPLENSWYLNHPLHHFDVFDFSEPRLPSLPPHTLTAFIDFILRMLYPKFWQVLYPNMFKFFDQLKKQEVPSSIVFSRFRAQFALGHPEINDLRNHACLKEESDFYTEVFSYVYPGE